MRKTIIYFVLILTMLNISSAYTLSGSSVYINDSKAYISANPSTMTSSGYVTVTLNSKQYSGDIDFAIGVNTSNALMTSFEIFQNITDSNGTHEAWVTYNLTSISYDYDGKDVWHIGRNINVNAGREYQARFYLQLQPGTSGKYDIAIKPSAQSIATAIANENFYLLDPWWNETSPTEFGGQVYPNYWSELDNGSSTARIKPTYLSQDYIVEHFGWENTLIGEVGRVTATNTGTATYISTGKIGGAYHFDGSSDYMLITGVATGTNFTISFWVNKSSNGQGYALDSESGRFIIMPNSTYTNGYIGVYGGASASFQNSSTKITPGIWQHLTYVKNGTSLKIYLNGSSIFNGTADANVGIGGAVKLGAQYTGSAEYFGGQLDEIKIWNKALDPSEISMDYNSGAGRKYQNVTLQLDYPYSSNLVEYWDLNGNTLGAKYVASGVNSGATLVSGKIGNAYNFNGTTDTINFSDRNELDFGTSSFAIEAWIRPNLNLGTTSQCFIAKQNNWADVNGWYFCIDSALFFGRTNGAAGTFARSSTAISAYNNSWTHVVAVINYGSGVVFYMNGAATSNSASLTSWASFSNAQMMTFGNNNAGTTNYNGDIDEVRFYNRSLTSSEISNLYNQQNNGNYTNSSANMFYSITNEAATNYTAFNATLDASDNTVYYKVSADNGSTWTDWLNMQDNGQVITLPSQGNLLRFQMNISNSSGFVTSLGLTNATIDSISETAARTAINAGIDNALPGSTKYYNQRIYTYTGTHNLGRFDIFIVSGTKRWAFNYITDTDTYTNMQSIGTTVNIWENSSLTEAEITAQVEAFINATLLG